MLAAAKATAAEGIASVFTRLGENVKDLGRGRRRGGALSRRHRSHQGAQPACEPSIKLTQLGLDIDRELAYGHLRDLAARAHATGNYLWIDMEQSPYVDITLTLTRRLREEFPRIGVCLQAYLFRTREDLEDMTARGIGVRLVKGAYNEPAAVAFPKKSDVDANYFALAQIMLGPAARAAGSRAVFGTHDLQLIQTIRGHAQIDRHQASEYEFHMLYGIQKAGAAAAGAGRRAGARADRLRRILVSLVHAPAGRAAGQRVVRRQEPLRLGVADLLDLPIPFMSDPLDVTPIVVFERAAGRPVRTCLEPVT